MKEHFLSMELRKMKFPFPKLKKQMLTVSNEKIPLIEILNQQPLQNWYCPVRECS